MTYRCRSAASGLPPLASPWLRSSDSLGLASSCIIVVAIVQPPRASRTTAFVGGLGPRTAGSEGEPRGGTDFDLRGCRGRSGFVPEIQRRGDHRGCVGRGLEAPRSNVVLLLSLFGNHGSAADVVRRRMVRRGAGPGRRRRWDWEAARQGA
ncbi:unnamed protein product [Triticum turgidum subsp. durum]|uniref:Uncharacterized protein n=1 Tax=Triticum turgidum subsp. durum TaxID=4567 RepID=A0A9R0Z9L5_TRITD|nr:unnamed protein product [Triticum turgidum subsp. durum]